MPNRRRPSGRERSCSSTRASLRRGDRNVTQLLKIDSHAHVYETREIGLSEKTGYEVWEYGELPGVRVSALNGNR